MQVGDKLKDMRRKLKLSQKDVAKELNVSRGYVSNIERGVRKPSIMVKLAIQYLFAKNSYKPEPRVEFLKVEEPKKSLFQRILGWFKK